MRPPIPTPKVFILEKNHQYLYCTCNKSSQNPFCDNSIENCNPLQFSVSENKKVFLCTCGATKETPYCDGSH